MNGNFRSKDDFFYSKEKYKGNFTLQNLVFNANLQEFSHKLEILCSLAAKEQISALDAYREIEALWEQLSVSKINLLGDSSAE